MQLGKKCEGRYREALVARPAAEVMQLVDHADDLGVTTGPEAQTHQKGAVERNLEARMSDVSSAPSLDWRVLLFNVYSASLVMYKAQFSSLDAAMHAS